MLAAYVSWGRLFKAESLYRKFAGSGPVLDFGASTGELGHLLNMRTDYHFIEQEIAPASYLQHSLPDAKRQTLNSAPEGNYMAVFALDALEHNENFEHLLQILKTKLANNGVLIISGPTESRLYRLGRRIAGFNSHYHVTNIDAIEQAAGQILEIRGRDSLPRVPLIPFFRLAKALNHASE